MKIYIVNLKHSEERRASMARQLRQHQILDYEFFEAVDGKRASPVSEYTDWIRRAQKGYSLNYGEIGCFLSHKRLWKAIVNSNEPAIVLEDDVIFLDDFNATLEKIGGAINALGYIRLGDECGKRTTIRYGEFFRYYSASCTFGYALNPVAAKKLLENCATWYEPVDNYMDIFWRHGVFSWGLPDPAVMQDPKIQSDIPNRRKQATNIAQKLSREAFRFYYQIRRFLFSLTRRKITSETLP